MTSSMDCLNSDWCAEAGLIGWPADMQAALLTALVTGQPLIFVGRHGIGKTLLCSRIATLLTLPFRALDASKSDLTDLLGYVSPQGLQNGCVEYIRTELSLWGCGFLLVDELNRARPQTLNAYQEVLYSRCLQGIQLNNLQYVWAAMNPQTEAYAGVGESTLDLALLSRFTFVIEPPAMEDLSDAEFEGALHSWADSDTPLLAAHGALSDTSEKAIPLQEVVGAAQARFPARLESEGELWGRYIEGLVRAVQAHAPQAAALLDMRSLKCAHRAIVARRALDQDSPDSEMPDGVQNEIGHLLPFLFPLLQIQAGKRQPFPWDSVHVLASEAAFGRAIPSYKPLRDRLAFEVCSLSEMRAALSRQPDLLQSDSLGQLVLRRLSVGLQTMATPEQAAGALALLMKLLSLMPDPIHPGSALGKSLAILEAERLAEDPSSLSDLADALALPPDIMDGDPALHIVLNFMARRRTSSESYTRGVTAFYAFLDHVRENPNEHLETLEQTRKALCVELSDEPAANLDEDEPVFLTPPCDEEPFYEN